MTSIADTWLRRSHELDEPVAFPRKKRRISGRSIAILAFLTICALFFCVPLYVIVVTSLKSMDQIRLGDIFSLPWHLDFSAWVTAWSKSCSGTSCHGVQAGFINSLEILFPSLILSIAVSSVTGYALALWNVKWANTFLFILFICAFVPFQIIMVPLIIVTGFLHVYGTIWGIAVVHAALAMPLLTLIFRNYYKGIPQEIMSAAMMDSGSFWRIFGEIIMPMSGNIMIVVLILQITSVWNDFLIGLTYGGIGAQPMTVILANVVITALGEANYNVDMAAALLTAFPPLIIYFVLGRFFVQGITAGAIKG
jgi:glucose/mannose transport system permease protein